MHGASDLSDLRSGGSLPGSQRSPSSSFGTAMAAYLRRAAVTEASFRTFGDSTDASKAYSNWVVIPLMASVSSFGVAAVAYGQEDAGAALALGILVINLWGSGTRCCAETLVRSSIPIAGAMIAYRLPSWDYVAAAGRRVSGGGRDVAGLAQPRQSAPLRARPAGLVAGPLSSV
jgi:hypothetical protein